jgi:hypothetical protein
MAKKKLADYQAERDFTSELGKLQTLTALINNPLTAA